LCVTIGAFGVGRLLPSPLIIAILLAVLSWSVWWHVKGHVRFPGDRDGVQANKELAQSGWGGALYFGLLLGVGFLTRMATPLWYALPLLGGRGSLFEAAALGVGAGLGRSWPAAQGAVDADEGDTHVVARALAISGHHKNDSLRALLAAGIVVAALCIPYFLTR
jgi:hypothetical protein